SFNQLDATAVYTLSLHDALPISRRCAGRIRGRQHRRAERGLTQMAKRARPVVRLLAVIAGLAAAASAFGADIVDAAQRNDRAAVLAALEQGADARARSADGTTALHWAVYHDDAALLERLLAAGADVNA